MLKPLRQRSSTRPAKALKSGCRAVALSESADGPIWSFNDDSGSGEALGSCLRCHEPPCMFYSDDELSIGDPVPFPSDQNSAVCSTGALTWPDDTMSPEVDPDYCIACGLCANRCIAQAITISSMTAIVNDEPNEYFELTADPATDKSISLATGFLWGYGANKVPINLARMRWHQFNDDFESIAAMQSTQFPNHLARNLMLELGASCAMSRRGNTNMRMDLLFLTDSNETGPCEVEFGAETLNSPRNLLDSMAILHSRYGIPVASIRPLIITYSLPNNRSDFWQILADFKVAIDLDVSVMTIGALVCLVWCRQKLGTDELALVTIDNNQPSLVPLLESVVSGDDTAIPTGYPGMLTAAK